MNAKINELIQRAEAQTDQEWHRLAQSTDGMPLRRDLFNRILAELVWKAAYEEGHDVGVDAGFEAGYNAGFTEQNLRLE